MRFALTALLFVLSGAAGLIDQVCFSKYLSTVVGSTAHAVSAVLAAFMGGMALGAYLAGKRAERVATPLYAYGWLEVLVAGFVALAPFLFAAVTPLYVATARLAPDSIALLSGLRWALATCVVVIPTMAMGATLPLLARLVGSSDDRTSKRRLAILYAANTLGGALGALSCAYLLLAELGLERTLWLGAALSLGVGIVAIALGRTAPASDAPASDAPAAEAPSPDAPAPDASATSGTALPATMPPFWLLAAIAAFSGAIVFAAEVVFTHLLVLTIGNSAFAFGLILAIFLVCLFLGATLAPVLDRWFGSLTPALSLGASALALAVALSAWDAIPDHFAGIGGQVDTFAGREWVRARAALSVLLIPVLLLGVTFPALLQQVAADRGVSHHVGRLTSINTLGAVGASLATGYFVLPALGSQDSLVLLVALLAFGAFALLYSARAKLRAPRARTAFLVGGALALASLVVAFVTPRWDLVKLTSGVNVYFEGYHAPDRILEIQEDVHGGVTTVVEREGVLTLLTNGKFQGNNGTEVHAQRYFAHYPSIFVDELDRALVIGLGTGTTLGTLTAYPYERIDLAEISPSIVDMSHRYFSDVNRGALDDDKVHLTIADGRNYLLVSDAKYNLIGMELTSIWFAGAASLYSQEFYALVKERLAEGGIFQQWVQMHHMRKRDFATVLNTLRTEFDHVALFYGGGQGILVASTQPLRASQARLDELEARPEMQEVLADRPLIKLTDDVLLSGSAIDAYLDDTASELGIPRSELLSTDDNLYLEYATPKGNVMPWSSREALVSDVLEHRSVAEIMALRAP